MKEGYYFIVNPAAGRGKRHGYISEIESFFHERELDFKIEVTTKEGQATVIARKASKIFNTIVAVGGDGTVNEVANGIIDTETTLGVLPIGSGNDFAHQMGYTSNIRTNLLILIGEQKKIIDVGLVNNDRYFINAFGVGFDAHTARRFKKYKKYLPGFPAYLLSVFRVLPFYTFRQAHIYIDETETIIAPMLLTAIGNGTTYGGGFKITPKAKFDDGELDICFVNQIKRLYALMKLPTIIKGTHTELDDVKMSKGKKIIIELDRPSIAQVDGEILGKERKYTIHVKPKALSVLHSPLMINKKIIKV